MAARQNRVASVFFAVASHCAETPPPLPRNPTLTGKAAILAAFLNLDSSPRLIFARRFRYNTHIPRGVHRDADEDGALGIDEGGLSVGWSCGEWFWRDRRGGGAGRIADGEGMRRIDWTLRLTEEKTARSVVGNVFSGAVDPTCFNPAWNMIRVVSRGAESLRVDSKITVDALKLRIR